MINRVGNISSVSIKKEGVNPLSISPIEHSCKHDEKTYDCED